jgi:hypothetical protein
MASAYGAKKIVTAKDADGNMTTRTIIVEGQVTIAIPTIRNRTDQQLQSRLLVSELPDFPGRVKHHAAAVSEQLLPDAAAIDHSHERWNRRRPEGTDLMTVGGVLAVVERAGLL